MANSPQPHTSLEQLGLYYMLERIHCGNATVQDVVRVGLQAEGLIDASMPPLLTDAGRGMLQALRALVYAANESVA